MTDLGRQIIKLKFVEKVRHLSWSLNIFLDSQESDISIVDVSREFNVMVYAP